MAKAPSSTVPPADDDGQSDIGALARQYVDLWQQQLTSAASDESLANMMAQTVQVMNAGAAAMASYAAKQATVTQDDNKADNGGNNNGRDSGAATVTASSGADVAAVDELHRRIDQLEKRIAALESGTGKTGS